MSTKLKTKMSTGVKIAIIVGLGIAIIGGAAFAYWGNAFRKCKYDYFATHQGPYSQSSADKACLHIFSF